ncbi:MAG: hypothetical protein Kapaf2KO_24050 [Candidatus Kapaibacteriales bacterium]
MFGLEPNYSDCLVDKVEESHKLGYQSEHGYLVNPYNAKSLNKSLELERKEFNSLPVLELDAEEMNAIVPGMIIEYGIAKGIIRYKKTGIDNLRFLKSEIGSDSTMILSDKNLRMFKEERILEYKKFYLAYTFNSVETGKQVINATNLFPYINQEIYDIQKSALQQQNETDKYFLNSEINKAVQRQHRLYNKLLQKLIPLRYRDKHSDITFWFYPTEELFEVLPDRYRDDIASQYELKSQMEDGEASLGESCVSLQDKTDYFGICTEKKGAIKAVKMEELSQKFLSMRVESEEARDARIMVADISGKVLFIDNRRLSEGVTGIEMYPDNLRSGAHFLIIETDRGEVSVEKVFLR